MAADAPARNHQSEDSCLTQKPKDEDITILIDIRDQVFAEYGTHARAAATGRRAHHLFMGRLVAQNGQSCSSAPTTRYITGASLPVDAGQFVK